MQTLVRAAIAGLLSTVLVLPPGAMPAQASVPPGGATPGGTAPGAPGAKADWLPADKAGFGTAQATGSNLWFTVQRAGGLGELYYPDLSTPSARGLRFAIADRPGRAVLADAAATVRTTVPDDRSLTFRQTFTDRAGHWRLTATYVSDPARTSVLVDLDFASLDRQRRAVYALYDPALTNNGNDDSGQTRGDALLATDGTTASAMVGRPAFTATSSGFQGTSDGWTDLAADGRLDWRYTSARTGNVVQTAATGLTGRDGQRHSTLALGFGGGADAATAAARGSLHRGFGAVASAYARGWHGYLAGIKAPPSTVRQGDERRLYRMSAMVLAASEDKLHRGAYVASPSMPWVWGKEDPSGPYHLVWSRDLYQIASSLAVAGDTAGANRALDYLFTVQQKPDGSFPQNTTVAGVPVWTGLQLDEVALPIVLAHQLGRSDAGTWSHVRRAADFLIGFSQDGNAAPWTPQERWENQSGYSPATIAAEIAGLVCAAKIARVNGDRVAETRYLATADDWQANVKRWTVTTTGPYSAGPYFLRLTKDGNPNAGTTYTIGDSGPSNVDQRTVVDPSFLDLVRLGVLPANDPAVVNTLGVIDAKLGVRTPRGLFWHRASFDGYGEKRNGDPWEFGLPDDSLITVGRAWPLLNGERGEYQLAAGDRAAARTQLSTMARAAGPGYQLPEQVWDNQAPAGNPGFAPGTPTFSATPLTWTHAQYVRLAWDLRAGRILEQPDVVAKRYAR